MIETPSKRLSHRFAKPALKQGVKIIVFFKPEFGRSFDKPEMQNFLRRWCLGHDLGLFADVMV
jgi:hypothetical protein